MKQIIWISLLLILIPFFIVTVFLVDTKIKKEKIELEQDIIVRVKKKQQENKKVKLEDYVVGVVAGKECLFIFISKL